MTLAIGTRVTTEYGTGIVAESSPRRVFIVLDDGQSINVATGTPGYARIVPDVFAPENGAPCTGCGAPVAPVDAFPGGLDLACYARKMEGAPLPTAEEIVSMWGGGR